MFREDSWKIVNFAQNQMKPTDEKPLILPSLFCPAASYYAMMAEAGHVVVNTGMRFDKRRKEVHRCVIADTRGPLELTVPIAKPYGRTWDEISVSTHGSWWNVVRTALESAYGRTPYFEFYFDDFMPLFDPGSLSTVTDLNKRFDTVIRRCLGLTTEVTYTTAGSQCTTYPYGIDKSRQPRIMPYWQVRADRFGFIPDLSILDLLFNMGPEALLWLIRAEQKND